jgi:hypothetical protein
MVRDQERIDQLSRIFAAGSSRRGILRALGVVGASGLLAVVGHEAMAGERPHQRLQDRTPKRNRKQRNNRNKNQVQEQDNNANNGGGGQLGSGQTCESQCEEQYEGCMEACGIHGGSLELCEEPCELQQGECEAQCPFA